MRWVQSDLERGKHDSRDKVCWEGWGHTLRRSGGDPESKEEGRGNAMGFPEMPGSRREVSI